MKMQKSPHSPLKDPHALDPTPPSVFRKVTG